MTDTKKGTATPRRRDVQAQVHERAAALRSWINDRANAREERRQEARKRRLLEPRTGGGHGLTQAIRAVKPGPQMLVHVDSDGMNRAERRAHARRTGSAPLRNDNVPYINPERDNRRGRRLRAELR